MFWARKIGRYEKGFLVRDDKLIAIIDSGTVSFTTLFSKTKLDIVNARSVFLRYRDVEMVAASGLLKENETISLNLSDKERAIVWKNGRLETILGPGVYVVWTIFNDITVDIVDTNDVIFEHENLDVILHSESAADFLEEHTIEDGFVGLFFKKGEFVSELKSGRYAFWRNSAKIKIYNKDVKVQAEDISGQEIMTADKVTLRINALVNFRVTDALKSVIMGDAKQMLYREAQMALRALIGVYELDEVFADKTAISDKLEATLSDKMEAFGLEIISFGIRDIILPGDMKELMHRVTEAKKAAEANLITRRDEVADTRSQINIANMLKSNETLMRMRELEVIEKMAGNAKLSVVLGEKGLERISSLI